MTNAEVQAGFTEVYNQFWLNYRDKPLPKDSDEWERMHTWAVVLIKKYPFLRDTVASMVEELDQRMRRRYYEPGRKTVRGQLHGTLCQQQRECAAAERESAG